jgi:hypothetical protein
VPLGFPLATATGNLFPNSLLPGTATQIGNDLASEDGHANPNALYLLSSGGNDITAAPCAPLKRQSKMSRLWPTLLEKNPSIESTYFLSARGAVFRSGRGDPPLT